jgi:ATP-dependent 26S proteasome regulatory subunit
MEDAEKAVISREEGLGNESLVSSLLNIGDGILGSMLNLSIILTFNTARENVDKALLRKGRLHYEHEFNKLSIVDAQALINKLKKKFDVVEPMSLAEIYNIDDDNNHKEKEKPKFGFGV